MKAHYFIVVVITSVSIKKNLSRPLSTISITVRIYNESLVLCRRNYIIVLDCDSSIAKGFGILNGIIVL